MERESGGREERLTQAQQLREKLDNITFRESELKGELAGLEKDRVVIEGYFDDLSAAPVESQDTKTVAQLNGFFQ